ncbi:MAG: tryptophan--tRNA ligase [Gammaproteobacteria bacterium]
MNERILTGITTTGIPHLGNFLGAIKPALEFQSSKSETYFFLADYHAIIKQQDPQQIVDSVKSVALAWLACGLDPNQSKIYRQSDVPEITELQWILNCVTAKGLMNRSHAYKDAVAKNIELNTDEDKSITMGLFSYPVLMSADILMFNATKVPVGSDQLQHLEMTRDIALRFNHIYGETFSIPEAIVHDTTKTIPGLDGRKMSKSYGNIIPLLSDEKTLYKSIKKIVTNSLEPGVPKEYKGCNLFNIFSAFASPDEIMEMKQAYKGGIGWGEAKERVFINLNQILLPIRDKYFSLLESPSIIQDVLEAGAGKVRPQAKLLLSEIKDKIGIRSIT